MMRRVRPKEPRRGHKTRAIHVSDLLMSSSNPVRASEKCDIVCVGDSITGWNNYGQSQSTPETYPSMLQKRLEREGHNERVANGGIAGEFSHNGPALVESYLKMFPKARYFIIGFGTNDLGLGHDHVETSRLIIQNMDRMVRAVQKADRTPLLINVPRINRSLFPRDVAEGARMKREHHNSHLEKHFSKMGVPIVDIYSSIKDEHLADNLHPNSEGARVIADSVYERLKDYIRSPRKDNTR